MKPLSSFPLLFQKGAGCPSSHTLLAYRRACLHSNEVSQIKAHLGTCDFCNAELQLLSRHHDDSETYAVAEMPQSLRLFAERLLSRSEMRSKAFTDFFENN